MRFPSLPFTLLAFSCTSLVSLSQSANEVIADFEGADFGDWEIEGTAFGKGPATGPVNGQMAIGGFAGNGFANSYHGGDDAIGTLTSPEFAVDRKFLNFLIGGGGFKGETCVELLVAGKVVREATGTQTRPGGNERLDPVTWDLADLTGKPMRLRIADRRKGGWGHITADHFVLSDQPEIVRLKQEFVIQQRYLIWPVAANGSDKSRFVMTLDGETKPFCFSDIALSEKPDFWTFTDLTNFQGRTVTIEAEIPRRLAAAWKSVKLSDSFPGADQLYREPRRPQFHFTSRRGWINDPNGLVHHDGTWHLFYQHNPYNHGWDNMHWGHATSPDLMHWTEHPDALFPDGEGYMYSGSGFVIPEGRAGFPVPAGGTLALAYTAEGTRSYLPGHRTEQGLAISRDDGKTFLKFAGNPVLPHIAGENRDPKVLWHEPTQRWVMALYLDGPDYGIFTSDDLVGWKRTDTYQIPGGSECPDLFELPIQGQTSETRWVVWSAHGFYQIGTFDGTDFKPDSGSQRHYFGNAYAGQSYDNAPDHRRVHIGWMREEGGKTFAGAPFNLQMTLPMDFTLRRTESGLRLHAEPSAEVASLRSDTQQWENLEYKDGGKDPLQDVTGELFEIEAVIDASSISGEAGFLIFGNHPAIWKRAGQAFSGMDGPQAPIDGKLNVRIFVDRTSIEVFVNGTYNGRYFRPDPDARAIQLVASGGSVKFDSLKVHTLRSVWK